MSKRYDKSELKEFLGNLIDDLEDGEYTVEGTYFWNGLDCKIKKVI